MLIIKLLQLLQQDPILFIIALIVLVFPLLLSITLHELAHGLVAYKLGDPTPKLNGRLTLNPFAHLDLVGTLMLFLLGIGWAKPIPINTANLNSKFKVALIGLAGPLTNFAIAVVFCIVQILCFKFKANLILQYVGLLSSLIVSINLILALFNLLPIPPLDGSRVLAWMLPEKLNYFYSKLEPYGMIIVLGLVFFNGVKFIVDFAQIVQTHLYFILDKLI